MLERKQRTLLHLSMTIDFPLSVTTMLYLQTMESKKVINQYFYNCQKYFPRSTYWKESKEPFSIKKESKESFSIKKESKLPFSIKKKSKESFSI